MKKEDIKRCIDEFEPDPYMKTRIKANIKPSKKRNFIKPLVSAVTAFALLIGIGVGVNQVYDEKSPDITPSNTYSTSEGKGLLDFSIVAYAASDTGETGEGVLLSEENINIINDAKIVLSQHKCVDSGYSYSVDGKCAFDISAENMKRVTVKTDGGTLYYNDEQLMQHLIRNEEYYKAIIPLSTEQNEYVLSLNEEQFINDRERFERFIKEYDASQYLEGVDFDECGVEYDDNSENPSFKLYEFELLNSFWKHHIDEINVDIYNSAAGVKDMQYYPDSFVKQLNDSAVTSLSAYPYPVDSIYITVEFESGESVTKRIDVYFGKEGEFSSQDAGREFLSLQLKLSKE
ncbi:MAG: hypothetical protein K2H13_01725 [Eubacterium sp.]|nr:hypothetical protein [Eubacterium sp.]MDE6154961.1 hypothetical protein [Eubacterium sp.]